ERHLWLACRGGGHEVNARVVRGHRVFRVQCSGGRRSGWGGNGRGGNGRATGCLGHNCRDPSVADACALQGYQAIDGCVIGSGLGADGADNQVFRKAGFHELDNGVIVERLLSYKQGAKYQECQCEKTFAHATSPIGRAVRSEPTHRLIALKILTPKYPQQNERRGLLPRQDSPSVPSTSGTGADPSA